MLCQPYGLFLRADRPPLICYIFRDMFQTGSQDRNNHHSILPVFRCNLFGDPVRTVRLKRDLFGVSVQRKIIRLAEKVKITSGILNNLEVVESKQLR